MKKIAFAAAIFLFLENLLTAQCLTGQYTVGHSGDFYNLDSLQKRLDQFGVCGPVQVLLASGEHNGHLVLRENMGISASNPMQIGPADGRLGAAVWTLIDQPELLKLEKTGHVRIHDLVFKSKYPVCIIGTESSEINVENCRFSGSQALNSNLFFEKCAGIKVSRCQMDFEVQGVYFFECQNATVENCEIRYTDYQFPAEPQAAVRGHNCRNIKVNENYFEGLIRFNTCQQIEVDRNEVLIKKINNWPWPGGGTNLDLYACDTVRVANNIFSAIATGLGVVKCVDTEQLEFMHNTVGTAGTGDAFSFSFQGSLGGVVFPTLFLKNNVFSSKGGGRATNIQVDAQYFTSNFNAFESSSANPFWFYTSLSEWQTATGQDLQSSIGTVPFFSKNNLRILGNAPGLAGKGTFLPSFSENDLDGDPRSSNAPDIGADQFSGISTDLKIEACNLPDAACHGLPQVLVKMKNDGASTARQAKIFWEIAGDTTKLPLLWHGELAPGASTGWLELGRHVAFDFKTNNLKINVEQSRDQNLANNEFNLTGFKNRMGGKYTVGGGPDADFLTLREAAQLLSGAGICAPTELLLAAGGHDAVELDGIPGGSATNSVLIRPAAQNGSKPLISLAQLYKARFLTLKNLDFGKFDMAWPGGTNAVTFEGCAFMQGFEEPGYLDTALVFRNCDFPDGHFEIGAFPNAFDIGTTIENCRFGSDSVGIFQTVADIQWNKDLVMRGNQFLRSTRLNLQFCEQPVLVENNRFGGANGALAISSCFGTAAKPLIVANNFIAQRGESVILSGFYCTPLVSLFTDNLDFVHNSVLFEPTNDSATFPAAIGGGGWTGLRFERNLIKTRGEATIWDKNTSIPWSVNSVDFNNYDPGTRGLSNTLPSLAQWVAGATVDANSTGLPIKFEAEKDPSILARDLHLAADSPNLPFANGVFEDISTDFDGQPRSLTAPNIGADEGSGIPFAGPVWPGDCDNDKHVTALDWLQLGLAIGQNATGPARTDQSINWSPKFAIDWPDSTLGVNTKHADCDGDGKVSMKDSAAVALNFGDEHFILGLPDDRSGVPLKIGLPAGPYFPGQKISAEISLGEVPEAFYGIAVELDFYQNSIKPGCFWVDFEQNWFGSDAIGFYEKGATSRSSFALTKTNGQNASGFGKIGTLHFTVGEVADSFRLRTIGTRGLLSDGSIVAVEPSEKSSIDIFLGQKNVSVLADFEIRPNPTSGQFFLEMPDAFGGFSIEIFNAIGKLVYSKKMADSGLPIDLGQLPAGIYQVRVFNEKGAAARMVFLEK